MIQTIPFDISYKQDIINGLVKVQTNTGYSVEIIKWDAEGQFPIVGLVSVCDDQFASSFSLEGIDSLADVYLVIEGNFEPTYVEDKKIISEITEYLECWNDFDSGDEPYEEYRKRFEGYITFMNKLLNRLHGNKDN
jgi:hypothetical protein